MRRKEGNKELDIINASVRVFSSVGYFDAKMHKIADEAGVACGTVYLYFKNKEEILLKIFETVWEKLFLNIEQIDHNEAFPVQKFHKMIDSVFDLFDRDPCLAIVFVNEQHHILKFSNPMLMENYQKTLKICEKVLLEGIEYKVFKPDTDPHIFSAFFFGGIRYLLQQWANDQNLFNLRKIRENIKSLVLDGIMVNKTRTDDKSKLVSKEPHPVHVM